jgi:hypothetical protein
MTCRMEMFARVLVRARVTTPDVAAGQAHPQVCPRVLAVLVALLAFAGGEWFRFGPGLRGRIEVFACIGDRRGAGIAAT